MSLRAMQLAKSGNIVSRLLGSQHLPLICATGLATIHFAMSFKVTLMRIKYEDDDSQTAEGTAFDYFRRCQLNVAEYNGVLVAMLLYSQYKMDSGAVLSKFGKYGSLFTLLGTMIYAGPLGMSAQKNETPTVGRKVGAIMRYLGFGALCYQLYTFTK